MKINFDKMNVGIKICDLKCGDTFIAKRTKPHENEEALYMVIDGSSGIFKVMVKGKICAINLSTGQVRVFGELSCVTPISTEVIFN